jgi:hypothetical protein
MNPAAFLGSPRPGNWASVGINVRLIKDAHSKRGARSSLGEKTTPRDRSLVVAVRAIHFN